MRFKADENLPTEAVAAFRRRGHDADSVVDEGLAGASDSRLADRLRLESRALVTLDVDFGNLKRYAPAEFPGLIVLRLRNQSRQAVLVALERVLDRLADEPLEGRLWSIDEASIRVHD